MTLIQRPATPKNNDYLSNAVHFQLFITKWPKFLGESLRIGHSEIQYCPDLELHRCS